MKCDKAGTVFRMICGFLCLLMLSGCTYDVPEGYLTQHHSYASALEYARSIDPEATVAENHVDLEDEYNEYRCWDAVIKGKECHVASCSRTVYNTGIGGGEFARTFYAMDTDYDYFLLESIVRDRQPQWKLWKDDISAYFQKKNQLFVYIPGQERQLTPEELTDIWKSTEQIVAAYTAQSVEKTVVFSLPAPIQVYNSAMQSYDTVMGWISFSDFTEAGKEAYFSKYADYWKAAEETQ